MRKAPRATQLAERLDQAIKQREAEEAAEKRRQAADDLVKAATQRVAGRRAEGRRAGAGGQGDRAGAGTRAESRWRAGVEGGGRRRDRRGATGFTHSRLHPKRPQPVRERQTPGGPPAARVARPRVSPDCRGDAAGIARGAPRDRGAAPNRAGARGKTPPAGDADRHRSRGNQGPAFRRCARSSGGGPGDRRGRRQAWWN